MFPDSSGRQSFLTSMQEILIVGHVCIDHNRTEQLEYEAAGSPAVFMNNVFRQFRDCHVTVISPYGRDFLPFQGSVNLYPEVPQPIQTLRYTNTVTGGGRKQECLYWQDAHPIAVDKRMISLVKSADIICFAPLTPDLPPTYVSQMKQFMKQDCTTILLPQGYFRTFHADHTVHVREFSEAAELLPLFDGVIVSDEDHPDMLAVASDWSERFHTIVIVTEAEKGASVVREGQITHVPTDAVAPSDIVSSVGAGDIFSAGFMHVFAGSRDPVAGAAFGNKLARACLFMKPDAIRIEV